jgi:hypothetical protein
MYKGLKYLTVSRFNLFFVIQSLKRFIIIKILNLISILGNKGEIIVIKGLGKFFRGECCSRFIIDKLMLDHIYDCV